MLRIALAFRAFFRVLFRGAAEELARSSKGGAAVAEKPGAALPATKPARAAATKPAPARNNALNLLAALTARGPVGRLHQGADQRLQRRPGRRGGPRHPPRLRLAHRAHFALKPIEAAAEGSEITVSEGFDPAPRGSPAMSPGNCRPPANCAITAGKPRAANCPSGPAAKRRFMSSPPRKSKSNSRREHIGRARLLPSRASGVEPRMTPMTRRKNMQCSSASVLSVSSVVKRLPSRLGGSLAFPSS